MNHRMFRFFDPKTEVNFIRFFRASLLIAALVPIIAIAGVWTTGLNWGIDFSGGMEMQVQFSKPVHADEIRKVLEELGYGKNQVQAYGAKDSYEMLIRVERMDTFSEDDVKRIENLLVGQLNSASVQAHPNSQDRLLIRLPSANDQKAQEEKLTAILAAHSGFRTRSILHEDSQNNWVEYNVLFMGVSDKVAEALTAAFGKVEVRRVEFVDSQVSKQLRTDGALAVFYAILAILIYIAIRFDLFFAPGAVVCLIQDTFGAFLVFVLGRYEFDLPSVAALLTVVGVSINNTIVVYDRIRETLPPGDRSKLAENTIRDCVNKAINDTMSRTINTSLTVLFSSISLWIFAGGVIKSFAAVLTIGLGLGAFSSTLAAPATYLWMVHYLGRREGLNRDEGPKGYTREEKARGVV
ncbi:MAG: protein translocase subunit SecF [Myxococcaceae bacterium]|nr:protein translocase subunit SecF [Myxococcaceae bacterium]MBH2005946.1 protein translocase subunit SecF [Myxococcaceae bacterium]